MTAGGRATSSKCGALFDAYVKQTLPPSDDPTSLWKGRRLRIKVGGWHNATVCEWTRSSSEPTIRWFLTISLRSSYDESNTINAQEESSIQTWNVVKLRGLASAAVYNDKFATVLGFDESAGRFQVKLGRKKVLLVKPENLEKVHELTRQVGRINIHGGGTLIGGGGTLLREGGVVSDMRLSFEWLDAAQPHIDLNPLTMKEEQFQRVEPVDEMPLEELEARRAVNLAAFHERTPSIAGPPDCNADGSLCSTPRRMAYDAYANEYTDTLIEQSKADLNAFRSTLMEQPLLMWNSMPIANRLIEECSIDGIKVMVDVLKTRFITGCFRKMVLWVFEHFELPTGCDTLQEAIDTATRLRFSQEFFRWTASYSSCIGGMHQESGEYRKAIPWRQQALDIIRGAYDEDHERVVECRENLALAYRGAGFLGQALETFDTALKVNEHSSEANMRHVVAARESLLQELGNWIGTCGYAVLEDNNRLVIDDQISKTIKMVPPQAMSAYLGGAPKGGSRSRNPSGESYVTLPRPLTLPPLHDSLVTFSDKAAKEAYMSIFNGDCTIEWEEREGELVITAECNLDGKFQGPLITMTYSEDVKELMRAHGLTRGFEGEEQISAFRYVTEPHNAKFRAYTSEDQKFALVLRVMHLFLRLYGARLTSVSIGSICLLLHKEYAERKWWAEAIDATVVWIDLGFTLGNCKLIHSKKAFNILAETLEANGKFAHAGQIYQDTAEVYFPSLDERSTLHCNSGLAYKRARDYTRAEKQYVAALHFNFSQSVTHDHWDLNQVQCDSIFTNMIVLYYGWCSEVGSEFLNTSAPSEHRRILSLLGALLFAAGFQASRGGLTAQVVLTSGPALVNGCLKAELARENEAKQALASIARTLTVSDFQSKILSCERPIPSATIGLTRRSSPSDKRNRKDAQQEVRNQRPISIISQCANKECDKVDEGLMLCSCRSVAYCSKECQKVHWKAEHRVLCTTRQKRASATS